MANVVDLRREFNDVITIESVDSASTKTQSINCSALADNALIGIKQTLILCYKHVMQKLSRSPSDLVVEFGLSIFLLLMALFLIGFDMSGGLYGHANYDVMPLPPIDSTSEYGVFNCTCVTCLYTCNFAIDPMIAYSPANHTGVTSLMNAARKKFPDLKFEAFSDPSAIYDEVAKNYFSVYAAIEFNLNEEQRATGELVTSQSGVTNVDYAFRFQTNNMWYYFPSGNNETVYDGETSSTDSWSLSGYLTIQNFIDSYLASQYDEVPDDFTINAFTKRFDDDIPSQHYPDHIKFTLAYGRFHMFKWIASIVVTMGLFYPMISFITQAVKEKQNRMFDLLQISGIHPFSYWFSYYITGGYLYGFLYIVLVYILLMLPQIIGPVQAPAYFNLLVSYAPALTAFALAFGHVVPRQEFYALPCLLILLVLAVSGNYFADNVDVSISAKLFVSFLCPPIGFSLGVFTIETNVRRYDPQEFDFTFINEQANLPRLNDVCGILFLSSCLYLFIAWGFPFDWLGISLLRHEKYVGANLDEEIEYPCDYEAVAANQEKPTYLVCDRLTQVFPDSTRAVSNLSFSVREGEVLSFLGANGAGDAYMNGLSITQNRDAARRNIGICFQQDVIWDDITVEDHLWIIGRLRGCSGDELRKSVKNMLVSLGFPEKAKSFAGSLSGGQKRRLCVGMSMVGGNKVVFLDEPTAGLDPLSRRRLWQLVQENRQGRAILLTTHFMDEADVLGDRIAIIKQGRLRACGSSDYLKKKFGLGFMMRFSLKTGADTAATDSIADVIGASISNTEVVSIAGTEMSVRLPKSSISIFPTLFATLEELSVALKIDSFGIETTTLEEIFLRLVNEDLEDLLRDPEGSSKSIGTDFLTNQANNYMRNERDDKRFPLHDSSLKLLLTRGSSDNIVPSCASATQIPLIFLKRFRQLGRSTGQIYFSMIVPIIFAIIAALTLSKMPKELVTAMSSTFYLSGATYDTRYDTPVAYSSAAFDDIVCTSADDQYVNGSCITNTVYVGDVYSDVNSYVVNQVSTQESSAGVVVDSHSNYTVLYNATWGFNLPSVMRALNNDAVTNATSGKLHIDVATGYLPSFLGLGQLLKAVSFSLVFSLMIGSLGAGIAVVLGSEKVQLVKHLQLTSGMHNVILGIALTSACDNYRVDGYKNGFNQVIGIMLLFAPAAVLRFHALSFVITDVKVAQSFFFYGGLGIMLFWNIVVYFVISSSSVKGNLGNPVMVQLIYTLSIVDPTFGANMLFLMQNNYLGIMETTSSKSALVSVGSYIVMAFVVNWIAMAAIIFAQESGIIRLILAATASAESRKKNVEVGVEMNTLHSQDNPLDSNADRLSVRGLDNDVVAENTRVATIAHLGVNKDTNAIFMHEMRKIYFAQTFAQKDKVAVRGMNLSIGKGESFGLLGGNGAGKTTTLKMISGLENPSAGHAYVNGYNAVTDRTRAQRSMGVCPQFDTLVEQLTVRENLLYFARLKGIPFFDVPHVVEAYMSALKIKIYEHKAIMNLSGGNRRKVSLAVALIGAPPTIYLDEPSTGLDPLACRLMWRLLSKVRAAGRSAIVLTTHNMLECESTCTRVGIMKNGELVCLGDTQHLRSTHGSGFLLEVHLMTVDQVDHCKAFIQETFPDAAICDEHVTMLNYEIPKASVAKLSTVFSILESNKERLGIADYVLSQSSLEQVFLKKIRSDNTEEEDVIVKIPPSATDYLIAYVALFFAALIPGLHRFILGETYSGVFYLFTLNELMIGWFVDWFRLPWILERSVTKYGHLRCCVCVAASPYVEGAAASRTSCCKCWCTETLSDEDVRNISNTRPSICDYLAAYTTFILSGIVPGFHRFALGDYGMGWLYLCTYNCMMVGWLVDLFYLNWLVKRSVFKNGRVCCGPCNNKETSFSNV